MKWYYKIIGAHTHVRVFFNGALCGTLVFRNAEWEELRAAGSTWELTQFIDESRPQHTNE